MRTSTSPPPARRRVIGAAACALLAVACTHPGPTTVAIPGSTARGVAMTVQHVVDGDTADLETPAGDVERVRLLGIDTPETVKPNTPVQCFGPEASARAKALLPAGTEVVVQRDAEARDRYGRLLAYVWRRRDGLFVNRSLVADGYARILSISPNTAHAPDLAAARAAAQAAGAGLWGRCGTGR
ncbi:MAG: nuclease (SNase domain protein) [Acidimicrobiales bacterium]|nr:nuclease (SNase domain protein) [Acidimicrobiales bacterium]